MKKMLKNYKVVIWLLLIVAAVILIAPNPSPAGIVVVANRGDTPLEPGDVIYSINNEPATPALLQKEYSGIVTMQSSKGPGFYRVNGSLGLAGKEPPSSRLRFGLDIEGGVRTVLKLESADAQVVEQSISTLQTRINLYGLREAIIRSVREGSNAFVEVSMAGGEESEVRELVEKQGVFEARIPLLVQLTNSTGSFTFAERHTIRIDSGTGQITIDGKIVNPNETAEVDGVTVIIGGVVEGVGGPGGKSANISAVVFSSQDINFVYFDPQRSGVQPEGEGYKWFFVVRLMQEGAERFAKVTNGLDITDFGRRLSSPLELYLDGEMMDSLSIASELKGQVIREPSVTGFAQSMEQAVSEQRRLQAILRSGALPVKVEVVKTEILSPLLGEAFLANIFTALIAAVAAVSVVVALRYRRLKIIIPVIITAFSEVIIILGMAVAIGWTLDLASMAGILAILGTGIDAQIIMIDQALKGVAEEYGLKERVKRALFMIVSAGGTTIAAMLPLMGIGLGMLRGFAIITIIGVIIGIAITRPAFGEMIKGLYEK